MSTPRGNTRSARGADNGWSKGREEASSLVGTTRRSVAHDPSLQGHPRNAPEEKRIYCARPRPAERAWSRVPIPLKPRLPGRKLLFPVAPGSEAVRGIPISKRFPRTLGNQTQGYGLDSKAFIHIGLTPHKDLATDYDHFS